MGKQTTFVLTYPLHLLNSIPFDKCETICNIESVRNAHNLRLCCRVPPFLTDILLDSAYPYFTACMYYTKQTSGDISTPSHDVIALPKPGANMGSILVVVLIVKFSTLTIEYEIHSGK